jgi:hypothetical protein
MSSSLTWSEKVSCGHSQDSYFGSLPGQKNVIMVYRGHKSSWRILFNDCSMRRAEILEHPSLEAAQAYAEKCITMPVSELGYRSLAVNAAQLAASFCRPTDDQDNIEAAIALGREQYPLARVEDVRLHLAQRFVGAGGFQRQA